MSVTYDVRGIPEVRRMLKQYAHPELTRRAQQATKAGGQVFKAPLRAEAGKVSRRMRKGVSVRRARRERPATIISIRPKVAFFRHMVIGGTKDHGPRAAPYMVIGLNDLRASGSRKVRVHGPGALRGQGLRRVSRVRGVKPNPMIARVFDSYEGPAWKAVEMNLTSTESKWRGGKTSR